MTYEEMELAAIAKSAIKRLGAVSPDGHIHWENITRSQCEALGGHLTGHACPYVPDIFFFSVILFFGTFALAFALKKFKLTRYFPTRVSLFDNIGT